MRHAKKTKLNSYMVAVQLTLRPVVYIEVTAHSEDDAVRQVDATHFVGEHRAAYLDEVSTDIGAVGKRDIKVISAGLSRQYHDASECAVCQSVSVQEKGGAK